MKNLVVKFMSLIIVIGLAALLVGVLAKVALVFAAGFTLSFVAFTSYHYFNKK